MPPPVTGQKRKRLYQQKLKDALEVNCGLRYTMLAGVVKKRTTPRFFMSSRERLSSVFGPGKIFFVSHTVSPNTK